MPKSEQQLYSGVWARWKKRVADGWGPVSALIAKDIQCPAPPAEPKPEPNSSRAVRIGRKLGLISDAHTTEPKFKVGDTVKIDHGGDARNGMIEEIDRTYERIFYEVRFNANDKRWLLEDDLQAVSPEAALDALVVR